MSALTCHNSQITGRIETPPPSFHNSICHICHLFIKRPSWRLETGAWPPSDGFEAQGAEWVSALSQGDDFLNGGDILIRHVMSQKDWWHMEDDGVSSRRGKLWFQTDRQPALWRPSRSRTKRSGKAGEFQKVIREESTRNPESSRGCRCFLRV